MAALKMSISCFFFLQVLLCLISSFPSTNAQLKVGYYDKSCPQAELIVKKTILDLVKEEPSLRPGLLRLSFHDCYVRGCDGSVLLEKKNKKAEKDAPPNDSLEGFDAIDTIKAALEKECPGIVSCSDVLALAARDAVVALNGPSWEVETGRRDGRVSNIDDATLQLPSPHSDITTLIKEFRNKGLSKKDLVVLSGAHTVGDSHCTKITDRLYNFTGKGDSDPSLDPAYAARLRMKCKTIDSTGGLEMDPGSFRSFDLSYYKLVSKRRGLFQSDAALLNDQETKSYILKQTKSYGSTFFKDFGVSMVNLGRLGVLTGQYGEVRKNCRMVNH